MLDIKLIREKPDFVRERLASRGGGDEARIAEIAALDEQRRKLLTESDALKAQRNQASKEIGALKSKGQDGSHARSVASTQMTAMKQVGERIAALEAELSTLDTQLQSILLMLPNLPHDSVPAGRGA